MYVKDIISPHIVFFLSFHRSHAKLNPYAIIPKGPNVLADLALPHGRDKLFS